MQLRAASRGALRSRSQKLPLRWGDVQLPLMHSDPWRSLLNPTIGMRSTRRAEARWSVWSTDCRVS